MDPCDGLARAGLGGAGADTLNGRVRVEPGDDLDEGADALACGDDLDLAYPGPLDTVGVDCEDVR